METNILTWHDITENDYPTPHKDILVEYFGNKKSKHFPDAKYIKQTSFYDGKFECEEEVLFWSYMPNRPLDKKTKCPFCDGYHIRKQNVCEDCGNDF